MSKIALKAHVLSILISLTITFNINAQEDFTITQCTTNEQVISLIDTVLLSNVGNYQKKNIAFTGLPLSFGYYEGGTVLGFESSNGIVMSTGAAGDLSNANSCTTEQSTSTSGISDVDLVQANGGSVITDVCTIEFDFKPNGDSMGFNYVFGSEEYHSRIQPLVSDIMGVFLSGSGLNGPYENNAINISILPETQQSISVGTLNCGDQDTPCVEPPGTGPACEYLFDNTDQSQSTFQECALNAFSLPFKAISKVNICEWYHVKISIGDNKNSDYDSGLFIEKESFDVGNVKQEIVLPEPSNGFLYESCGSAIIYFSVSTLRNNPYMIPFSVNGSALEGIDYSLQSSLQDTILIEAGSYYDSIVIVAYQDAMVEDIESIRLVYPVELCNPFPSFDTAYVYISDIGPDGPGGPISISITDSLYCYSTTLEATPGFSSYMWNTGDTTNTTKIYEEGNYSVIGFNTGVCPSGTNTDALGPEPGEPVLITIADSLYCYSTMLNATPEFDKYLWSTGDTTQSIEVFAAGSYSIEVTSIDTCKSINSIVVPSHLEPFDEEEICLVTADEVLNKNVIIYEKTFDVRTDSIIIYKQDSQTSLFEKIGTKGFDEEGIYVDTSSSLNVSHSYKISVKDSCGRESDLSNAHRTILLQANTGINEEINLHWNAYEGFDYPNFGIYRSHQGGEFLLIANVPNNVYSYTDDNHPSDNLEYQIGVEREEPCNPIRNSYNYSFSNKIDIDGLDIMELQTDDFKIFPNPTSRRLKIQWSKSISVSTIEIVDINGKVLETISIANGTHQQTINTENLIEGVYSLRINEKLSLRFIKTN